MYLYVRAWFSEVVSLIVNERNFRSRKELFSYQRTHNVKGIPHLLQVNKDFYLPAQPNLEFGCRNEIKQFPSDKIYL